MALDELRAVLLDLLRRESTGVLSTISVKLNGVPFGSVVDFALDNDGRPVLLMSGLAQHTKNARVDPRASLTVRDSSARTAVDGARVTMAGRLVEAETREVEAYWKARFPESDWSGFGDFSYWRLEPESTYVVAGFGAMGWI